MEPNLFIIFLIVAFLSGLLLLCIYNYNKQSYRKQNLYQNINNLAQELLYEIDWQLKTESTETYTHYGICNLITLITRNTCAQIIYMHLFEEMLKLQNITVTPGRYYWLHEEVKDYATRGKKMPIEDWYAPRIAFLKQVQDICKMKLVNKY